MTMKPLRSLTAACAVSLLSLGLALAQTASSPSTAPTTAPASEAYEPKSGQAGKDVVWVPTQQTLVDTMLNMAGATPADYVIDLGSGDGRTVITAAKRGIRALGIEYNPDMVALSQRNAQREGVTERATFRQGDIFETDFSDATVLTLFLLPELNVKLRPTILNMKPGTRVVSNSFTMDDWESDESVALAENCASFCRAHKWVVPAKVAGTWRLPDGELRLTQKYQMLTGTLTSGGKRVPISEAKMNGAEIVFTAAGRRYTGKVENNQITGSREGGGNWTATRSAS
ncbi:class I SAM-dependent methyltransferase [Bosea sp. LjRoot237]|uniref:class I SAM-dependent methyltransferase n=1 Tax=Bosea sp. LjRoot237 TaxID=3342292 RepID=UPI003ED00B91